MIEARQLVKQFGGRTAVDGVSVRVARGEVVGLLGPNGAGKSTVFRILAGICPPDTGTAVVDGHDLTREPLAARRRLGYAPERPGLQQDLTVEQELTFVATLRGVASRIRRRDAVEAALERMDLREIRRRRVGALSRGTRQRVSLAAAVVGDPPALLLDEPTAGLDPAQSADARALLRTLGRTAAVLVSSHVLADVETLCDRVVILDRGRVLADEPPGALAHRLRGGARVIVEAAAPVERLRELLTAVPGVDAVLPRTADPTSARCRVDVVAATDVRAALAEALVRAGVPLLALEPVEPSLEATFLSLTRSGSPPA